MNINLLTTLPYIPFGYFKYVATWENDTQLTSGTAQAMTRQRRDWPGPSISADAENGPWQTATVIITTYFIDWLLRVKCSSYSIYHNNPPRYVNYLHFRENWSCIQRNFQEFLKVTSKWYKPLLYQAYKNLPGDILASPSFQPARFYLQVYLGSST